MLMATRGTAPFDVAFPFAAPRSGSGAAAVEAIERESTGAVTNGAPTVCGDEGRAPVGRSTDTGMIESIADGFGAGCRAACDNATELSATMVTTAAPNVAETAAAAAALARTDPSQPPPRPRAADQTGSL